jgi:type IX secretion system PorP/SprF family membrane protein
MLRKCIWAALAGCIGFGSAKAQQVPLTVLFMHNQMVYNPAAAGMHETDFNVNLVNRFQWGGKSAGGPISNMLWSDYRFAKNKAAAGLNINYDKLGATSNLEVLANYAYYIPLTTKLKLSMGLRAGVGSAKLSTSTLNYWDPGDPIVDGSDVSVTTPKFGGGFQLTSKKFYAGVSVPDFLMTDKYNLYGNKDRAFFQKKRNYILMSGYKIKLNDSYKICPNVRFIYFPGTAARVDFNSIFEITDYFWAGITYSTSKNHSVLVGTHISSRIRLAYAYEFNSQAGGGVRLSTHEINVMLNLDDFFKK